MPNQLYYDQHVSSFENSMSARIMQGLEELSKEYVQYIADNGPNRCEECRKNHEQIFEKDDPFKPKLPIHPNCKCKYIPSPRPVKELHFRVDTAPLKYNIVDTSIAFSGNKDFIEKLEKQQVSPHSIDKLVILNHSGNGGFYPMGNNAHVGNLTSTQIKAMKKVLHKNSVVDIRMCYAAEDEVGETVAQELANKLGCKVLGYAGPVSTLGTRGPFIKNDPDRPLPIYKRYWPDHKPTYFYPK